MVVEGKEGEYKNIRIQEERNEENIQLQMYTKTKKHYVFVFTLVNDTDKLDTKCTYFAIQKRTDEVELMGEDNHQSLITAE
jgi:hypothetical protein